MAENSTLWTWGNQQKYHTEIKEEVDKKLDDYNVTAQGNPVTINGLQGGVPFSEITVKGENPPITGQELTVRVSGKNLISNAYDGSTNATNVKSIVNSDGSITFFTSDGGVASSTAFYFMSKNMVLLPGIYTVSAFGSDNVSGVDVRIRSIDGTIVYGISNSNNQTFEITSKTEVQCLVRIQIGTDINGITVFPQLEIGSTATAYEPYSGADYAITPDSNPYTVPTEIYQQNGVNTVYVTGEGEPTLSVKGVKTNAALAKLWSEKMNTDDAQSTYVQKSGDTMEGVLVAQSNVAYTTAQVRNITMSTETASGGSNGQIHFQYT